MFGSDRLFHRVRDRASGLEIPCLTSDFSVFGYDIPGKTQEGQTDLSFWEIPDFKDKRLALEAASRNRFVDLARGADLCNAYDRSRLLPALLTLRE
jgi:hypothetical protein